MYYIYSYHGPEFFASWIEVTLVYSPVLVFLATYLKFVIGNGKEVPKDKSHNSFSHLLRIAAGHKRR